MVQYRDHNNIVGNLSRGPAACPDIQAEQNGTRHAVHNPYSSWFQAYLKISDHRLTVR